MKYHNNIFILLLFLFEYSAIAQSVRIAGKANTYEGKEISAFFYDDLISFREKKIGSATINDNGAFELNFNTNTIKYVFLKIENRKADLYVEPFSTYEVIFLPKDSSGYVNSNTEESIDLAILKKDSNELNVLMTDFNRKFDDFWINNYEYFIKKSAQTKIDSFKTAIHKTYASVKNDYFFTFVNYKIASLQERIFESRKKLAREYIFLKPVYYENYEYMSFFNSFFKNYLQLYAYTFKGAAIQKEINENVSYTGLMEALFSDTLLRNDTLRELVLLKGLSELYYVPTYKKENIAAILEQLASKSIIPEYRKIATNILYSFSKQQPGTKAPGFKLIDQNNKPVSLDDFKGKYIYLDFWATWCTPCLQEMKIMPELYKKYGDRIQFISISIDKDEEVVKQFLLKHPKYNWTFLHYGNDKIKEDYNIKAIPTYFLINPQGYFMQVPADAPSGNIEETFYSISKSKEKK